MHSMKHFSHWAVWILAVVSLTSVLYGAYYMNEYQSLKRTILQKEAAIEGFLSHQSALNSKELCRNNFLNRLESFVVGHDVCE